MAKPNYNSKKRQKEIARQEKQELKRQRKMDRKTDKSEIESEQNQKTGDSSESS